MSFRPKTGYNFTVLGGNLMQSQGKGTPGFQVFLEHEEEGETDYTIWLTPKNREKAEADFATLGIQGDDLRNSTFMSHQIGDAIKGREVYGYMVEEEYKGKVTVKVGSIGQRRAGSSTELANTAASFFGAALPADEDVPF